MTPLTEKQKACLPGYIEAVQSLHDAIETYDLPQGKTLESLQYNELYAAQFMIELAIEAQKALRVFHKWDSCPNCKKAYDENKHDQWCPHCGKDLIPF